ncbi:MAG TPA: TolC family protein [Kofleriaceae bacterium]|nr:TolC family protein [Kofleriaceae bacterium]
MKSVFLIAAALAASASVAIAEPRTLTFPEAIQLAAGDSVAVDIGKEQVVAAQEKEKSTRAMRLPSLSAKGNLLYWNEPIVFSQPCTDPDPMICPKPVVSLAVRDQVTATGEVDVAQPISGLIVIGRLIAGDRAGVDAARAELDVTRLDAGYKAAEAYLGALQAETLQETAEASVKQLEADLGKVRALRDAHVLADVDVLRLEAARDQAQDGVLQAQVSAETARRGLALLLDLPDGTDLTLAPVDTTPPDLGWTEDDAVAAARKQRPELRAAAARQTQAQVGVDAAKANYYPNVLAVGNYTHSEGQGFVALKDSAFVGVTLDWNLWDWGKREHDIAAAKAASRIATRSRQALDDQLAFDVRSKWLTASTRQKSLAVNASALKAAEEAYRLQTVKIEGGVATATDVIDAEAEVSRARAQATVARYQYLIAWMALVRAVGQLPSMPAAAAAK